MRLIISFQYAFEKHHAGFKVLSSRLQKLENLDLSVNQYNDSIFPSLTGFSSLKSLDLSYNQLTGSGIRHSFYPNASPDILLIILFFIKKNEDFISI
jgi:Leucine-rich repeat (LRR) protein